MKMTERSLREIIVEEIKVLENSQDEEMRQDLVKFLEDVRGGIESVLEGGDLLSMETSGLVGKMVRIGDEDFYNYFWK